MLFEDKSLEAIHEGIRKERLEAEGQLYETNENLKDYYEGRQYSDLASYGFEDDKGKTALPMESVNIFRKIINKISLVYKYQPDRLIVDSEDNILNEWYALNKKFGLGFKYAERYKNTLGKVLLRVHFDTNQKRWFSFVETIYEAHFIEDENPLVPFAYSYPYKQVLKSNADVKEDWWIFWSDEHVFAYIPGTDRRKAPNILDGRTDTGENPYGIKPMIELRKDFPVDQYDCVGAVDLLMANKNINIAINDLNLMIHKQAFDQMVISGLNPEDVPKVRIGADFALVSDSPDTTYSLLNFQPKITECIEAIRMNIQLISYVYNLQIDWALEGTPASGFSLLVKNIDLSEAREDDVELAELAEDDMYRVVSTMQEYHKRYKQLDSGEPMLPKDAKVIVNFEESLRLPVQQSEELEKRNWEIDHNIKTPLDYMDSNMDDEEKMEIYQKNKKINGNLSVSEQVRENLQERGVEIEE